MKKLVVPVLAAAFAATMSLAQAATMDGQGVIQTINTKAAIHTIVLKDGKSLQLAKGVSVAGLKVGENVSFKYETTNGKMVVSQIHKAAN